MESDNKSHLFDGCDEDSPEQSADTYPGRQGGLWLIMQSWQA
mgnify:CR=1 FL=1